LSQRGRDVIARRDAHDLDEERSLVRVRIDGCAALGCFGSATLASVLQRA
jgi:hypothetical protein